MRELLTAEPTPRRIRASQQLALFGSSVILGPPQVFAIAETGTFECADSYCGCSHVPMILARTTDYANRDDIAAMDDPAAAGWSSDGHSYLWSREVAHWSTSCRDFYCENCETVENSDSYSQCSTCESCENCCECWFCEGCEENIANTHDLCGDCERCSDGCCECVYCEGCGERCDNSFGSYCDHCDDEDEDCGDESEDCETITTYRKTSPSSGTRTFGVELENVGNHPRRQAAILRANGFTDARFLGYTKGQTHIWKTVTDSSVGRGGETVSPILCGQDGFDQLEAATLALLGNGSSVDGSCGTHVHVGCEDLTSAEIVDVALFYNRHAEIIDEIHAPSRRGRGAWSGPFSDADMDRLGSIAMERPKNFYPFSSFARDRSVNLTALPKYGTIEFRQHAGTLNGRKLSAWIRFLFAIVEAGKDGARISADLPTLLATLGHYGLPDADAAYLQERADDLSQRIAAASASGRMSSFAEDDA